MSAPTPGCGWSRRCACRGTEVVVAPAGDAREALRELNADADVVYAELDARRHAADVDPGMDDLWGLENIGQNLALLGLRDDRRRHGRHSRPGS